jgi:hypothetical protein
MAEADAEDGHDAKQAGDGGGRSLHCGGVPRPVGQEHPVRPLGRDGRGRRGGGDDFDGRDAAEVAEDVALDAEVVGHHLQRTVSVPVGSRRGDRRDQVDAVGARFRNCGGLQRRLVGGPERARHGSGVPDVAGQPAGIDPGQGGDPVPPQELFQRFGRPPATRPADQVTHDHTPAERMAAFVVIGRHPVVPDVGVSE